MTKPVTREEFCGYAKVWTMYFAGQPVDLLHVGYVYNDDPDFKTGLVVIGASEELLETDLQFQRFDDSRVAYYFENIDEVYDCFLTPSAFMARDATLVYVDGVNTPPDDTDERGEVAAPNETLFAVEYVTRIYVYAPDVQTANERSGEVLRYNDCRQCAGELEYNTTYVVN